MYEEFFNLSGSPFRLAPDPKFFFGSKSHNKAMAYLHYGLRQAEGFIVITGEIGAGKSILIGHLLDQLDRSNVIAANLLTPNLEPADLLSHVLSAFRIEPSGHGKTAEIEAFEDFLFDQMNHGRRVLLVVDEAQNLPRKTLEELRVLSNLNYDGTPLFQAFLVGQPDFRETMARSDMEQLRQRVIASYHLEPMSREETERYIEHRLGFVGWDGDPKFSRGAYDAIYAATGGLPRRIHKLCNRALLYCSVEKLHQADAAAIAAVLADMDAEQRAANAGPTPMPDALDADAAMAIAARAAAEETPTEVAEPAAIEPMPAMKTEGELTVTRETSPADVGAEAEVPSPMSVFDRIKSGKSKPRSDDLDAPSAEPSQTQSPRPPKAATLDDVAQAILTARPSRDVSDEFEEAAPADERAAPQEGAVDAIAVEPPPFVEGEGWKKSVVLSINDTRQELKRAHESVTRLRRHLTEIDRRRRKRRVQIAASLDRAESLLVEFQNAWR